MKNEYSLECSICGKYNIEEGVILYREVICWDCIKKPNFKKLKKKEGIKELVIERIKQMPDNYKLVIG